MFQIVSAMVDFSARADNVPVAAWAAWAARRNCAHAALQQGTFRTFIDRVLFKLNLFTGLVGLSACPEIALSQ